MDDLIERLRAQARHSVGFALTSAQFTLEWEAAAELARLTAEVEGLRVELRECNCPRPINTATDESTAWCVDTGYCGCGRNVLLGVEKGHGYAAIKEAGNG